MERKFCGDCGTALWSEPSVLPGKAFLKVSRGMKMHAKGRIGWKRMGWVWKSWTGTWRAAREHDELNGHMASCTGTWRAAARPASATAVTVAGGLDGRVENYTRRWPGDQRGARRRSPDSENAGNRRTDIRSARSTTGRA